MKPKNDRKLDILSPEELKHDHVAIHKEQRHLILLPAHHPITRLLVRNEHVRLHHAGTQATLYSIRQT